MHRKVQLFEEIKKKYVRIALETNKVTTTAKSAGVSRRTLQRWIQEYGDSVRDEMDEEVTSGEVIPVDKSA